MLARSITFLLALAGHAAWFQINAIILATFILEDAAIVAAAMQVEDGVLPVWLALVSLYSGILLGDLGLYGLGRLSAYVPWVARQLPLHRQEAIRAWISGRIFKVVLVSRFLAGLRLPTYTTCVFRRRRSAAVHPGGHPRHRRVDQPVVRDIPESGAFPDDHLGACRWAGAAGFVVFIIVAGRVAAAGMQGAGR